MAQEDDLVLVAVDDSVATITINNPRKLNAFDRPTVEALWRRLGRGKVRGTRLSLADENHRVTVRGSGQGHGVGLCRRAAFAHMGLASLGSDGGHSPRPVVREGKRMPPPSHRACDRRLPLMDRRYESRRIPCGENA